MQPLSYHATNVDEVAQELLAAKSVIIVPGYGLAVARAQHAIADIVKQLESKGVKVKFGIHPVAGRMPGQVRISNAISSDISLISEIHRALVPTPPSSHILLSCIPSPTAHQSRTYTIHTVHTAAQRASRRGRRSIRDRVRDGRNQRRVPQDRHRNGHRGLRYGTRDARACDL
jgi:NAD(P) transhydrogenase beta subunit